jgi:hypothetical protein
MGIADRPTELFAVRSTKPIPTEDCLLWSFVNGTLIGMLLMSNLPPICSPNSFLVVNFLAGGD